MFMRDRYRETIKDRVCQCFGVQSNGNIGILATKLADELLELHNSEGESSIEKENDDETV